MKNITRRNFIEKTTLAAGAIPLMGLPFNELAPHNKWNTNPLSVCIFSKHLQFIDDFKKLGEITADMGFAGVDLTVRNNGHIAPNRVKTELPSAIEAIKKGGSTCTLISTTIQSVQNPLDVEVIETAAKSGVKFYRPDWFKYLENMTMEATIAQYKQQIKALSHLNQTHGIVGCYQNHSGTNVGAMLWEVKEILADANAEYFGVQYDIRHNMVEGYKSWENALKLIQKNIKTIVIKDYKFIQENGVWKLIGTPLGEGMVDFKKYFKLLKGYHIQVPVSLHMEYPLGGAENGDKIISIKPEALYDAMKKDLNTLNKLWLEA